MNNISNITQIIEIKSSKVTCLWNIVEVKVNDFEEDFKISNYLAISYQHKNFQIFKYVSVSEEGTFH